MQEKMRKKGELISAVSGFRNTPPMDAIVALLELYIELTRIQNDVAQESELKHNQGKIAAFRELKDVIVRGNPEMNFGKAGSTFPNPSIPGARIY
jgi:hypothetical protein